MDSFNNCSGEELRIRKALGEPHSSTEHLLLYHGDCLKMMNALPGGIIDLTVTSPPYNIGKEYERPLPLEDYVAWTGEWTRAVHRVARPDGRARMRESSFAYRWCPKKSCLPSTWQPCFRLFEGVCSECYHPSAPNGSPRWWTAR